MGWDVVVVGAGTAGIPCAVEASRAGARVLMLERESDVGGALHVSGGQMSGGATRRQRELGIEDSPARHLADLVRISGGTGRPDLQALATELAPDTIDWLEERGLDVDPATPRLFFGHEAYSVPRTTYGLRAGLSILDVLRRELAASEVEVRLGCRATGLVVEAGRVVGVATADGELRAPAVVLATGGFGSDPDLFRELEGRPLVSVAAPGSTGDGLRMARAVGAGLQGLGTYLPTFGGLPDPQRPGRSSWTDRPRLIAQERPPWEVYVGRDGRRFVAEDEPSIDRKERALLGLEDMTFWSVFDDRALEASQPVVAGWSPDRLRELANSREGVSSDPTLAGLAGRAGIDAEGLAATVADYNAGVTAGRDRLGRRHLPAPIATPPFYALRNHGITLITFTGVDIDSELRVRGSDGTPIAGLYAVGEVIGAGATSGNSFCGGMMVTPAIGFGRLLGRRLGEAARVTA